MDFLKILAPIEWVVAWIMYLAHSGLTALGLPAASGVAWGLSIVVLVIVMRILLIPLFFKQIKASRGMQMIAPEMQAIQKKYKGKTDPASREAMSRETMALYKKHGTNPFASCLPILAQSPIFFALFRVLNSLDEIGEGSRSAIGPLGQQVAQQAERSTIFGAPLSATFMQASVEGDAALNTRLVTVLLIIAMSATTFLTQRQLTMKNMPPSALQGPMAQQQKVLLYVLPLIFAFTGVNFPIGVLIYWTTTNIWSMGQQFYTIRRMPAPGSEAERRLKERRQRKGKDLPGVDGSDAGTGTTVVEAPAPKGQRQQPVGKARAKAKPTSGTRPATTSKPAGSGTGDANPGAAKPGTQPGKAKPSGARPGTAKSPGAGSGGPKPGATKPGGPPATGSGKRPGTGPDGTPRRKPRPGGATAMQPSRAQDAADRAAGPAGSGSGRGPGSTDTGDTSPTKPTN